MDSDTPLMGIRRRFLKENRPGYYREMREDGTLDDHLRYRAAACGPR